MNLFGRQLDPLDLIVAAAAFGLVLGTWLVAFFVWRLQRARRAQEIGGRLGLTDAEAEGETKILRLWQDGKAVSTAVPRLGTSRSIAARLGRIATQAELETGLHSLILGTVGAGALGLMLVYMLTENIFLAFAPLAVGLIGLRVYVQARINRRTGRFERQFVDALDLAARSLRAGHPLLGAFRLIADEIPAPVGAVFESVCQRHGLGLSLEDALRQAGREYHSHDLNLFVTSVIIQMRSGGNLADMMERIAFVMRDRMKLARKVRTLTAQTQLSKRILIALPFAMFVLLNVLAPSYTRIYYTSTEGQIALGAAAAAMVLGWWAMNKMVIVRY